MSEIPANPDASPEAAHAALDRAVAMVAFAPKRMALADLPGHGTADPNELLRHRFLCRGGGLLFVSQTGLGKSSFMVQAALHWTLGRPLFGLEPVRPLRVWYVQAENDAQDLGEMRDGVTRAMVAMGEVTQAGAEAATRQVSVFTEDAVCGEHFGPYLDAILADAGSDRPDVLIVDPAFAYFGGDMSAQAEVSPFLRNVLNPVIHRHNVGLILVHHTTKPQAMKNGQQGPSGGDYAYLGAGSAELANWARAVLSIQEIRNAEGIFVLRAGKRGRRLGWMDTDGNPTTRRHIAHAKEPGAIYWRTPDPGEIPEKLEKLTGRPPKTKTPGGFIPTARGIVMGKPLSVRDLKAELQERAAIGEKLAQSTVTLALSRGELVKVRAQLGPRWIEIVGLPGEAEQERDRLQEHFRSPELPAEVAK